jgi:hypothetical protein
MELAFMGQMQRFEESELSTFTPVSLSYRQTASMLGKKASVSSDAREIRDLLELAKSWILLAENEELMASEARSLGSPF